MAIDSSAARSAVKKIANGLDLSVEQAAEGIYNIVNENMFGALRLVSVEQGHDPRDFALIAFGGAGPLHANALGKLMGSWPVIIPPGPGVLCAYGDATTRLRNEASRTLIRRFSSLVEEDLIKEFKKLAENAEKSFADEETPMTDLETNFQADVRYHGQGLSLTVEVNLQDKRGVFEAIAVDFDVMHEKLFTFALPAEKELVNIRAVVLGEKAKVKAQSVKPVSDISSAKLGSQSIFVDGNTLEAEIYRRDGLGSGSVIIGPAIVTEMDSTTLILPHHQGLVDDFGNIIITPETQD
jgi:N-methylhydantoinase A